LKAIYVEEGYPTALNGKDIEPHVLVAYACSACVGFLGTFEHDIKALRGYIDALSKADGKSGR
jgi:hypothetical protein